MDGFLTEDMMKKLQSSGFDIHKFYSKCFYENQFLIVETKRRLTTKEIEEMRNDDDNVNIDKAYVIEKEELLSVKIGSNIKLPAQSYVYITLSTSDLITYLENYFICNYNICCEKYNEYNYVKIEYIENNKLEIFQLEFYNPSFDYLLYSFVTYLLTQKKYLLKI
jgi:hypothetical protein